MIGTLPMVGLAPQEYRNGLDAAATFLPNPGSVLVLCNVQELEGEVYQRFPPVDQGTDTISGLWIEPLVRSWEDDLLHFANILPPAGLLAVIASLPLAHFLPERRTWEGSPLCLRPDGIFSLRRFLIKSGFQLHGMYGFHTPLAMGINLLSNRAEGLGYPALGDRLQFASRLRYSTAGIFSILSTVALIAARKKPV